MLQNNNTIEGLLFCWGVVRFIKECLSTQYIDSHFIHTAELYYAIDLKALDICTCTVFAYPVKLSLRQKQQLLWPLKKAVICRHHSISQVPIGSCSPFHFIGLIIVTLACGLHSNLRNVFRQKTKPGPHRLRKLKMPHA